MANCKNITGHRIDRNNRGFSKNDPFSTDVDKGIGG